MNILGSGLETIIRVGSIIGGVLIILGAFGKHPVSRKEYRFSWLAFLLSAPAKPLLTN